MSKLPFDIKSTTEDLIFFYFLVQILQLMIKVCSAPQEILFTLISLNVFVGDL